ncbi:MAG TPA: nitrite reductase (NAD(P)H) small subunit [Cyclobacteriaceae bacterium]|nr:nitrite reductase (NAD(P)H) small subunit [Cyclobacteriaceae bacterium]
MEWVKIFSSLNETETALPSVRPRLLMVRGLRICLVMKDGSLFAVEDTCPHNGESLSKGAINFSNEVVCPWHGHRFNLKTGRECEERSRDLITYPVKIDSGGVFIGL